MWRDSLQDLAAAIRANPSFPKAARALVSELVAWRTRLGVNNRVLSNLGREHIIEHLMFLHCVRRAGPQENGATFERLAALSESRDRVGARAVRTALRLLQIAGLAVLTRSRNDARLRIFEPTQALFEHTREYYSVIFGVFDELLPGTQTRKQVLEDPDFIAALLERVGARYLAADPAPNRGANMFTQLLRLEGARPILAVVVDSYWRQRDLPTPQQLAQRFHVSGSQARVILKTAAVKGLVTLGPRSQLVDASSLVDQYLSAYCRYLAFFAKYGLDLEDSLRRASPPE